MPVTKRQLAASIASAAHISNREIMAAFVLDEASVFGANPFAATTAGAVRQVWGQHSFEFRVLGIHAIGLAGLLEAVSALDAGDQLTLEILRSGPYTLQVFHHGDGCRIVGAVLHGKAGIQLPTFKKARMRLSPRKLMPRAQLDLFAPLGCG